MKMWEIFKDNNDYNEKSNRFTIWFYKGVPQKTPFNYARNLVERSQETALLEAVGFRLGKIRKLSFFEHAKMACWGILIGSISAVLGIAPALFGAIRDKPETGFVWFFLTLAFLSFSWVWIAVSLTLRESQIQWLKNE